MLAQADSFTPSALIIIDGMGVTEYTGEVVFRPGGSQDFDAQWNRVFYNPATVQSSGNGGFNTGLSIYHNDFCLHF